MSNCRTAKETSSSQINILYVVFFTLQGSVLAIASGLPFSNFSSAEDFPSSGSSRLSEAELQCDDPVAEFSTKAYKVPP